MKYLKTYRLYESDEIDYYDGLTKEDIEDMFIDVSDMGYDVRVILHTRMVMDGKTEDGKTRFGEIPIISVVISLPIKSPAGNPLSYQQVDSMKKQNEDRLRALKVSDEFNSVIDEVNHRISHNGWYIFDTSMISGYGLYTLKVFLQRKQDSKYNK